MTKCPICHAWLQQGIRHFCIEGSRLIEVNPDDAVWGAPDTGQAPDDPILVFTPSDRKFLRSLRIDPEG